MMLSSFLSFINKRFARVKEMFLRIKERDIIFVSVVGVAALFVAILSFDAYLFYGATSRQRPPAVVEKKVSNSLSKEDIDTAIRTLDARAKKFNEILGQ